MTSKLFQNFANKTFHFKESLKEKESKNLRGSGEIARKKKDKENGGQMNIGGSYVRSSNWYLLTLFIRYELVIRYELFSLCSGQFRLYWTNQMYLYAI